MGHLQLNRYRDVVGVVSDPTFNYRVEGLEMAAHFVCGCSHFATLCREVCRPGSHFGQFI